MARKITGLNRLQTKLARIRKDSEGEVLRGLLIAGQVIAREQKRLAPKKSGKLRDSIEVSGSGTAPKYAAFQGSGGASTTGAPGTRSRVTISAGNNAVRYAHLVEFGTAPHSIKPKTAEALALHGGRFAESVEHPGAAAKPFFFPGYRATRKKARSIVGKAVRESVKKAVT